MSAGANASPVEKKVCPSFEMNGPPSLASMSVVGGAPLGLHDTHFRLPDTGVVGIHLLVPSIVISVGIRRPHKLGKVDGSVKKWRWLLPKPTSGAQDASRLAGACEHAPKDFDSLEELSERLLAFQERYSEVARPFERTLTKADPERVIERVDGRGPRGRLDGPRSPPRRRRAGPSRDNHRRPQGVVKDGRKDPGQGNLQQEVGRPGNSPSSSKRSEQRFIGESVQLLLRRPRGVGEKCRARLSSDNLWTGL